MISSRSRNFFIVMATIFLSSCATIVGGSSYNAHITVVDKPNARIYHKGVEIGAGSATLKVKRKDANKFTFTVSQEGCKDQKYNFTSRTFRGLAFVGSIILWTGYYEGLLLPWGMATDLITGSVWKPNVSEKGVSKVNYKNFDYKVRYSSCLQNEAEKIKSPIDVIYMKDGSIIKGVIKDIVLNESLQIEVSDGSIFQINIDEIERISKLE